ncbi:fibronectin type III-like domain-containing protein, partial [Mycena sp. CBHHK59/15]
FYVRFGLSYTKFSFSNLIVSSPSCADAAIIFSVSVTIKNDRRVTGSEIAQLYISYPEAGVITPIHQLKGFAKALDLAPGASQELVMNLDKYAVSFWDTKRNAWTASAGKYVLDVGASSQEQIRAVGLLQDTQ